jgi:hypothetical protein
LVIITARTPIIVIRIVTAVVVTYVVSIVSVRIVLIIVIVRPAIIIVARIIIPIISPPRITFSFGALDDLDRRSHLRSLPYRDYRKGEAYSFCIRWDRRGGGSGLETIPLEHHIERTCQPFRLDDESPLRIGGRRITTCQESHHYVRESFTPRIAHETLVELATTSTCSPPTASE